jgi:uncharacterized protein (UPF0332 family)
MSAMHTAEVKANIERAEQAVNAAQKLLLDGYHDFAASRAYYAVFYAASALLLQEGLEFRKHSGVIAAIHQHFIKTGRIEKEFGKNLNWLFELRSIGDYGVTTHVPAADAEQAINTAMDFLQKARTILSF